MYVCLSNEVVNFSVKDIEKVEGVMSSFYKERQPLQNSSWYIMKIESRTIGVCKIQFVQAQPDKRVNAICKARGRPVK